MPYIDLWARADLGGSQGIRPRSPETPGELNYVITKAIVDYYDSKNFDYQVVNDIIGALEGAKLEFYRRMAVPYEDQKIKENGDVY